MIKRRRSHYDCLRDHLVPFAKIVGLPDPHITHGLISAHGDKCYSYKYRWKKLGIPFAHGVALYLLTYIKPYSLEVRETKEGWVDPCKWVIDNYRHFKNALMATFGEGNELED